MSNNNQLIPAHRSPPQGGAKGNRLCVLLTCFDGSKSASKVRKSLDKRIKTGGNVILDEVVLRIDGKRKVQIYDPRKTVAGILTPALTWGVFGLLTSAAPLRGLTIWAVIGGICGGLYAYFTEHALSKTELKRIGQTLPADTSAITSFVQAIDAESLLAATSTYNPSTVSVAVIEADLSARVMSGASNSTADASRALPDSGTLLSMLLFRYPGEHTAKRVEAKVRDTKQSDASAIKTELVIEVNKQGKIHAHNPAKGVMAMAKTDVIVWGLFGVLYGALVGYTAGSGTLGFLEKGLVTGIAWGIFGLIAGILYGLWVGQAMSGGRLKGIAPLLPPDTSLVLAWGEGAKNISEGATETITALTTNDSQRLILRFNPVGHGALLQV